MAMTWSISGPHTLSAVKTIQLDEGFGFAYDITLDAASGGLLIDASQLIAAPVSIDGSADNSDLSFGVGTSGGTLTGGIGDDTFFFQGVPNPNMHVIGGDGLDVVSFYTVAGAPLALTLDAAHLSGIADFEFHNGDFSVVISGDLFTGYAQAIFDAVSSANSPRASSLSFDGSAEKDHALEGFGSVGDDRFVCGSRFDMIRGNAGNDLLNCGGGSDAMPGGPGNDVYIVDNILDAVKEFSNEGRGTVKTFLATYVLVDNVENLILSAKAILPAPAIRRPMSSSVRPATTL